MWIINKIPFDNSAYGIGSDNGYGHGSTSSGASANTMQYGSNISAYNLQYHAPADLLPFSTTFKVGVTPGRAGGTANDSSHSVGDAHNGEMTQFVVTTQPIDGLTVSASYYDFGQMGKQDGRQKKEGGSLGANFSMGSVLLVMVKQDLHQHKRWVDLQLQTKLTTTLTKVTVSVLQLTKTYQYLSRKKSLKRTLQKAQATDAITRSDVMEIQTIDLAYTVGGATFSVSTSEGTNDSYTTGDDSNEHIFAMSLAF